MLASLPLAAVAVASQGAGVSKFGPQQFKRPLRPYSPPRPRDFVAYMQVVKDDICLQSVCNELWNQGVEHFAFFQPSHYWSGEVVPPEYTAELEAVLEHLNRLGANVYLERTSLEKFWCEMRIDTETKYRNYCIERLQKFGFKHVLIVDGDELWIPGALNRVRSIVARGAMAISVGMIPVVGIPPYPIEDAQDKATVYVDSRVRMEHCRKPKCPLFQVKDRLIYHFTGVRPTMQENIKKHERSGHFDDPKYDYAGWLAKGIWNIKPGDTNVHFYRHAQIWPKVRDWKPGEKEKLPKAIFAATR